MEPMAVVVGRGAEAVLGRQETAGSVDAMQDLVQKTFNPEAFQSMIDFETAMKDLFPKLAPLEKSANKTLKARKDAYDTLQEVIRTTLSETVKVCRDLLSWIEGIGELRKALQILTALAEAKKTGDKPPNWLELRNAKGTWEDDADEVLKTDTAGIVKTLSKVADDWTNINLRCQKESEEWQKLEREYTELAATWKDAAMKAASAAGIFTAVAGIAVVIVLSAPEIGALVATAGIVTGVGSALLWLSRRMRGLAKAGQAVAEDAEATYEGAASAAEHVAAQLKQLAALANNLHDQSSETKASAAQKAKHVMKGYVYWCLQHFRSVDDLQVFLDSGAEQVASAADLDVGVAGITELSREVVVFIRTCIQMNFSLCQLGQHVKISLQATDRQAAAGSGMESE